MFFSNGKPEVFDYGEFKDSTQTENTYISETM